MSKIHSVSFKESEEYMRKYANDKEDFSAYIKSLIKKDIDKSNNIFTEDEKEEIKRIVKEIIVKK